MTAGFFSVCTVLFIVIYDRNSLVQKVHPRTFVSCYSFDCVFFILLSPMTGPSHSAAPLPPPVHLQRRLRQETPPANIARKSKRFLLRTPSPG